MLKSSLSDMDGSVRIVDCGQMLSADSCPTLRLLWPVAARLSLFSLPVVAEDAWEAAVIDGVTALSSSCLWVIEWGGTVSDASLGGASGWSVACLRVSSTVL